MPKPEDRPQPGPSIARDRNPKCVVAGCGKEVTWEGPTYCPEHMKPAKRGDEK